MTVVYEAAEAAGDDKAHPGEEWLRDSARNLGYVHDGKDWRRVLWRRALARLRWWTQWR